MARNDGAFFRLIIILVITVLCLGISLVQMAKAYQEFGGIWLSGVFSFAVVLILFYLIFALYRARQEGKRVTGLMSWYLIFVVLSFTANFTSFYTILMRNEVLTAEVNDKYSALRLLKEDARIAFLATKGDSYRLADLLSQLKSQILNDPELGCGKKCKDILANINDVRRKSASRYYDLTLLKLRPTSKTMTDDEKKEILTKNYNDYYCTIIGQRECQLQDDLDKDLVELEPKGGVLEFPSVNALEHIEKLVKRYNERASTVRELVPDKFKGPTQLSVENGELGKISQTLGSAYDHRFHWGTWVSALAALLIDLIAPVFVIGFIGTDTGRVRSFIGRRRGAENLS